MEPRDLTPAEARVWAAFPRGTALDFRTAEDEDITLGAGWGPDRTLRAEVLTALLLDGPRESGEIPALRIAGARITGQLALLYGQVECTVSLLGCHLDSEPLLFGARMRRVYLGECVLPGLAAGAAVFDGDLSLVNAKVGRAVSLTGAQIGGSLTLDGAVLGADGGTGTVPGADGGSDTEAGRTGPVLELSRANIAGALSARSLVAHGEGRLESLTTGGEIRLDTAQFIRPGEMALRAAGLQVGTFLSAVGMVARGEVRLYGTTVGSTLNLSDARLDNPADTALHASNLAVGSDLKATGMTAHGRINLRGARIPGQLNLTGATLRHPGNTALRASGMVVGELWLRGATPIEGAVVLRRSQIDLLHAEPEVWPDQVRLDGLTYTALAPHEPAARRLPLLARDTDGYVPFSYEQLALSYRGLGDDDAARTVQLAKQRRHRATLPPYAKAWGYLQDVTVGYGFRPVRAAGSLLSLLLIGWIAYGIREPRAVKPEEAPDFSPFFFTLDLLLPIVDLGQEKAYTPEGLLQKLAYVLILAGWVLATTVAAGVTRTISRQ
ncbi:membrane-associated oxidoreductase [Streptomyces sp. TRM66268-LWL]|uniref:Membrane-associated oxidoreductase n=1 Tax=Streptomyces polyasparticus TaxID=2767826 RepID=A0ABR7S990_9ACTN|nr:membrane-associated oxidoreductase [Streptomyces polyasparticus]MBC9712035.1 membrane-associated oxidoreductase [Streptomyces polyasparticus]